MRLQRVEGKRIAGISARCSNDHPEAIGALWQRFFAEGVAERTGGRGLYAVYFDYAGDHTAPYTLLLGGEVAAGAALPEGIADVRIEAGNYQPFDASGDQPAAIIAAWERIWQSGLDRAYRTDFELYGPNGMATVYIGLKQA